MIRLIRRIFGTKITVTQSHINRGIPNSRTKNPVALAIQDHLDLKYGYVGVKRDNKLHLIPKKEIYVDIMMCVYTNRVTRSFFGIGTLSPRAVRKFLDRYDFYGIGKPFTFYYCI